MTRKKGNNHSDLFNMNRSLVLRLIYEKEITTRSEISRITGLTEAAISKIVSAMVDLGIVIETDYVKGLSGRRAIGLRVNSDKFSILGVKLSRHNFTIGKFDITGNLKHFKDNKYVKTNSKDMTKQILDAIHEELNKNPDIVAVGMAVPGPFDSKKGKVLLLTEVNDFFNINIKDSFQNELDIPLIIGHDANAAALASRLNIPNIDKKNLVYYLVGQGVGVGAICNGNLVLGNRGMAGEIGHVSIDINGRHCKCGNYGCLETYCSSIAFINEANRRREKHPNSMLNDLEFLTVKDVFDIADKGDLLAIELAKETSDYIAYGAVNIINTFNPRTIIIGDEMSYGEKYIRASYEKIVKERVLPAIVEKTTCLFALPDIDYVLSGAAALAIDYCLDNHELLI